MWQFSLNFIDLLKWLGPLLIILSVAVFFKKEKATLLITLILTYFLIVFGSYVRLTDSGLGCPDWPGCYAQLSPFGAESEIEYEENLNPLGYVTKEKAWIEMLHRYLATIVGVLIVSLFIFQIINLFKSKNYKIFRYGVLLFLVIIQGLFGKWTVTMELKPIIVTSHLLFGFTVFTYMSWIYQSNSNLEYIKRDGEGIFGEDRSMPIIAVKTIKKITLGLVNKIKLFNSLNICDILMKLFSTR